MPAIEEIETIAKAPRTVARTEPIAIPKAFSITLFQKPSVAICPEVEKDGLWILREVHSARGNLRERDGSARDPRLGTTAANTKLLWSPSKRQSPIQRAFRIAQNLQEHSKRRRVNRSNRTRKCTGNCWFQHDEPRFRKWCSHRLKRMSIGHGTLLLG